MHNKNDVQRKSCTNRHLNRRKWATGRIKARTLPEKTAKRQGSKIFLVRFFRTSNFVVFGAESAAVICRSSRVGRCHASSLISPDSGRESSHAAGVAKLRAK